jgi:hypothetical protein
MRKGDVRTRHLVGKRFGAWTVLERLPRRPGRDTDWLCRCQCGTERPVRGYALRAGISTSCGAAGCRQSRVDLRGQRYGDLTILHEGPRDLGGEPPGRTTWVASCMCGRVCVVPTERLRHASNPARSCGHDKLLPAWEGEAPATPRQPPAPPARVNGNGHHPLDAPELSGAGRGGRRRHRCPPRPVATRGERGSSTCCPMRHGLCTLPSWVRVAPPVPAEPAGDEPDTARCGRSTSRRTCSTALMFERHNSRLPGRRTSRPVSDSDDGIGHACTEYDPYADDQLAD